MRNICEALTTATSDGVVPWSNYTLDDSQKNNLNINNKQPVFHSGYVSVRAVTN